MLQSQYSPLAFCSIVHLAKKLKAELIHKAKVKKDYAKVLKQEEDSTPEFYKKVKTGNRSMAFTTAVQGLRDRIF